MHKNTTDSYEEGRLRTWSRSILMQPEPMKQNKKTCSIYVSTMMISRILIYDGTQHETFTDAVVEGLYKSKLQDSAVADCIGSV